MKKILLSSLFLLFTGMSVFAQSNALDSLRNVVNTHPNDTTRQLAYNQIFARTYFSMPDSARYYSKRKLADAKKMKYLSQISEAYKYIGITFAVQNVHDSSIYYYEKGLELSYQMNDSLSVAYNLHNIAYTYWKMNQYPEALERYFQSLEIKEELFKRGNHRLNDLKFGASYENIGITYSTSKDTLKAYEYYLKARQAYSEVNDIQSLGQVNSNIGTYFSHMKMYDSAYFYYSEALKSFDKVNNLYGQSVSYNNIGAYFFKSKKSLDSAAYYFQKAVDTKQILNDMPGKALSMSSLAGVKLKMNQLSEAQRILNEAFEISEKHPVLGTKSDLWFNQMRLDTAKNDFKSAFFSYLKYDSLQSKITSDQRLAAID